MKTAYPIVSNPVTITLYANIPFDNTYKHHSLISSLFKYGNNSLYTGTQANVGIACERFLNRRNPRPGGSTFPKTYHYPRWTFTDTFNFHYSNGLISSVVLELTPEQTNANYMKVVSGASIYYYFITSIMQTNVDTYTLALELDVLMTYQDEFLEGVKNVPIFTTRKHSHRFTTDGIMPYCADLKTGEDVFANVKPSIITSKHNIHFEHSNMKALEGVIWLYMCCDVDSLGDYFTNTFSPIYHCNNKAYPMSMVALPINVNSVTYRKTDGTKSVTFTANDIKLGITKLIGAGSVHGAKVSPFPPFNSISNAQTFTKDGSGNLVIASSGVTDGPTQTLGNLVTYSMSINGSDFMYGKCDVDVGNTTMCYRLMYNYGGIIIQYQNDTSYDMDEITPSSLGFVNATAPSIYSNRYTDPKLLFSPFKKYLLTSQYAGNGWEFYPELIFSQYVTADNYHLFWFECIATSYIGDNNFYCRLFDTSTNAFNNYQYDKVGLMASVNYIMPCGENALDVFNATQSQSFYTSKVASGVTSGITLAGGIASVVAGAGLVASGGASPAGIGLIAGGATAIASGTAGIATTIKSANAKIEDLKNTPDSLNVTGSNFIIDESIATLTNGLPYVLVYDVTEITKKNADDFFYQYGYQVSRDCYFNTDLQVTNTSNNFIDNNIFGRTIFNYVQINEDITNKIDANIPLIAKQKLSSILNNGITLWSFFGMSYFWSDNDNMTNTQDVKFWFMNNGRDNTEYKYS